MRDIGLVKLFAGGRVILCVPAGMAAGYAIALVLGLPALIGIMLGALPPFLTCFVVVDKTAARVASRSAALYVPFLVALLTSIALREFRTIELILIVGLLFLQFYAPRFGVWAGDFGAGLFAAYLCGLLLPLPLASFPGMALIFAVALVATILVRWIVFHPNAYRSLMRTSRAFLGWQTRMLEAAAAALAGDVGAGRALQRHRRRAHEAALIAEGLLGTVGPEAADGTAETLHVLLFDSEQAVDGLVRLADELIAGDAPQDLRDALVRSLRTVLDRGGVAGEDAARVLMSWVGTSSAAGEHAGWVPVVNRAALLLSDIAISAARWSEVRRALPASGEGVPFQTPVVLAAGRPAGAAPILDEALASNGMSGPWKRIRVSPPLRAGIQAAIAVAITEPLTLILDGQRFYWGVIGVMVILAGTNSAHDRLRKAASRGIGTIVGGVLGIALVDLLGTQHVWWTLVVVVVALAGGMYGFSRSYLFWVVGLVVALCQVYAYSGQFSDALILFRLIDNLIGAFVALGVSAVVLPVATGAMIRRATLRQLVTVRRFMQEAAVLATDGRETPRLRTLSRSVDHATYQLESVFQPLVRFPSGGGSRKEDVTRTVLGGVARTVRGVAYRGGRIPPVSAAAVAAVVTIMERLDRSIAELAYAVEGEAGRTWTSSSNLIGELEEQLQPSSDDVLFSYRLRAFARIDEALGALAEQYGMDVESGTPFGGTGHDIVTTGRRGERLSGGAQ